MYTSLMYMRSFLGIHPFRYNIYKYLSSYKWFSMFLAMVILAVHVGTWPVAYCFRGELIPSDATILFIFSTKAVC